MTTPKKKDTTTPENLPLADRIAISEDDWRARVTQAREEIANGTHELAEALGRQAAAEENVEEVEAALRAGDPNTDPGDLPAARGLVQGIAVQVEGIRSRLDRARRHSQNQEVDAALGLVALVNRALPGVPVHVLAGPVPALTEADVPAVLLRQVESSVTTDGTQNTDKRAGVEVVLTYVADVTRRELDHDRFERIADRLGVKVDLGALRFGGLVNAVSDRLHIATAKLRSAEPAPTPVIAQIGASSGAGNPLDVFAREVGLTFAGAANFIHGESTASIINQSADDSGVRTIQVQGSTMLTAPNHPQHRTITTKLEDLLGTFARGLGRVRAIEELTRTDERRVWKVVLESRESHEVPHPDAA